MARPARGFRFLATVVTMAWWLACPSARGEELVDFYVGAGCFWHVQEVVNMAEEEVLGRDSSSISGVAGYAGGKDNAGDICYTNYAEKGQAEVVMIRRVPRSKVPEFVRKVWPAIFAGGARTYDVNIGTQYRAALGLPGGAAGALFGEVDAAQPSESKAVLQAGVGDDADTVGKRLIDVYDTAAFPFHQAELYHQFHNYKHSYAAILENRGDLKPVSCPSEHQAAASFLHH